MAMLFDPTSSAAFLRRRRAILLARCSDRDVLRLGATVDIHTHTFPNGRAAEFCFRINKINR
jgi:hypothetical protein